MEAPEEKLGTPWKETPQGFLIGSLIQGKYMYTVLIY